MDHLARFPRCCQITIQQTKHPHSSHRGCAPKRSFHLQWRSRVASLLFVLLSLQALLWRTTSWVCRFTCSSEFSWSKFCSCLQFTHSLFGLRLKCSVFFPKWRYLSNRILYDCRATNCSPLSVRPGLTSYYWDVSHCAVLWHMNNSYVYIAIKMELSLTVCQHSFVSGTLYKNVSRWVICTSVQVNVLSSQLMPDCISHLPCV